MASGRHADVAELRGVERAGRPTGHHQPDVAICREGSVETSDLGPARAVAALERGDHVSDAGEPHPGVRHRAGAAVSGGGCAVRARAAHPAVGIGAGQAHEDVSRVARQRVADHHADPRRVAGVLEAVDPGDDLAVAAKRLVDEVETVVPPAQDAGTRNREHPRCLSGRTGHDARADVPGKPWQWQRRTADLDGQCGFVEGPSAVRDPHDEGIRPGRSKPRSATQAAVCRNRKPRRPADL